MASSLTIPSGLYLCRPTWISVVKQGHMEQRECRVLFFFYTKYESVLVHVQGVLMSQDNSTWTCASATFYSCFYSKYETVLVQGVLMSQNNIMWTCASATFYSCFYTKYETVFVQWVLMSRDDITWTCAIATFYSWFFLLNTKASLCAGAGSADVPGQHHVDARKWRVLFLFLY